ncbi:TIGR04086 family membrane protein [Mediterraneibacter sp.]|uniref:TIGR04086 family membrane protein n=1 Tax=Mediterraneibacter sp. TaxID=2316022 RepID=UPI0027B9788E|nr:TIGR04086 family membrane protein [Mediterraneibacter sp.]
MEAKEYGNAGKRAIWFVKSLLCGYIVTGLLLLILALMLYKFGLNEQNVNAGIVLIYVISTFSAGFVLGKLSGTKKFLWGLLAGMAYFLLLMLITLGIYHAFQGDVRNVLVTFLLCAGGGMLGGMIA